MKYSIDFHKGVISGWIATDLRDTNISLTDSLNNTFVAKLDRVRKDVVLKGFTHNELCGFNYSDVLGNSIEGDFFISTIKSGETLITGSKFCGDYEKWSLQFDKFQIKDRNDFSIQDSSIEKLFSSHQDIIAFKILMIRLRRGKRAFKYRGSFEGHEYPLMNSDWEFFKSFYIKHFDSISRVLSIRSLWSIVDTFVDFGSPLERCCALAISNYMYQERFAQTYSKIFKLVPLDKVEKQGQSPYWGGMLSNRLLADDSYDVFLTKNIEVLEYVPILKKTFLLIFVESLKNDNSIASMNSRYSEYFSKAFDFYEKYFFNYNKK